MRKTIGFVVTAGHLDIEWYQPMRSYRFWTVEALEDLKKVSKERSDFDSYLLDGQVFPLEQYLEVVPEDENEMRELVKSGKLAIGPFYTQFDEWLPSAESMIRNCLYGRIKANEFGGYVRAGYLPDNFGHPRQLPQILNNFGIDSMMFMRGMPEVPGGHPDEFIYEGLDGSQVLVCHFRESYGGAFDIFKKKVDPMQPREVPYYADYISYEWHKELADHDDPQRVAKSMIENVKRRRERFPSDIIPLISGYDHFPPQMNIGDSIKAANEMQDDIEFVMGNPEQYVLAVQERLDNPEIYNMELIGSRYHHILLGALSTRSYLKRQNFAAEVLLERYAEPIDAIASIYGYPDKPTLFDEAWKYILINSAHDSIHGSSVDEVHVEMESRFANVKQIASGIIHDAMKHMGKRIKPWWNKRGVLSYAPVELPIAQPAEVWAAIGDDSVVVCDKHGNKLPTQILDREPVELNGINKPRNERYPANIFRKVLFMDTIAQGDINSYAIVSDSESPDTDINAGDTFIENEFIRVETNGALINIFNKETNSWSYNLNLLEEDADAGDAWDYSPPWIPGEIVRSTKSEFTSKLVECGPVRAVIEMNGIMNVPVCLYGDNRSDQRCDMPVTFLITVYTGTARVDVKLKCENTARDHRIRLRIPSGIKTKTIKSQGHLAIIDRPIERQKEIEPWLQPSTQLLPFREWVAVEDQSKGLAIALKGVYDYEAVIEPLNNEPDIYFTLLRGIEIMGRLNTLQRRGAASPASYTPDAQCSGEQVIEWSYIPYKPDVCDAAPFLPLAQSFLYPVVTHAIRAPQHDESIEDIPFPIGWDKNNIQFSAFKRSQDRTGYILRIFENQGKAVKTKIKVLSYKEAYMSNMNEDTLEKLDIKDGHIEVDIGAYKAVTIKFCK